MSVIYSSKTYGHNLGFSSCFRQWRAESHCRFLHGYALEFTFYFGCSETDDKNWVVDFGGLKRLREELAERFDHKTLVAQDDPFLESFKELDKKGIIEMKIVDKVGCEAFAEMAFEIAAKVVNDNRVYVKSCEVKEHGSNSALFMG